MQGLTLKSTPNTPVDRAARNELLDNAARSLSNTTANSLPEMINLAANRAIIANNQGQPAEAEAILLEALDAARRAGQEEPNLTAILVSTYALQKKYPDAEAAIQRVLQTRVDMFLLAENYAGQRKYADAERVFGQLLESQRRVTGPEVINTVVTISNIGWVRLQQKRYAEAERTFREASAILLRTEPSSWERFNVDSMLGASLSAQRKFEEAEPLLISGYTGMSSGRPLTNSTMSSRFTREQAGEAIVQLYLDWAKPAKQTEWSARLRADKDAALPAQ